KRAEFKHERDSRMVVAQALEYLCAGRIPAFCFFPGGQAELFKQRASKLLWRFDVEFVADLLIVLVLYFEKLFLQCAAVFLYPFGVYHKAGV
ncbi:hypothetical protein OSJ98_25925, partial [Escherichia coli]|nr:hypothetical protein [Escherichia coli]